MRLGLWGVGTVYLFCTVMVEYILLLYPHSVILFFVVLQSN